MSFWINIIFITAFYIETLEHYYQMRSMGTPKTKYVSGQNIIKLILVIIFDILFVLLNALSIGSFSENIVFNTILAAFNIPFGLYATMYFLRSVIKEGECEDFILIRNKIISRSKIFELIYHENKVSISFNDLGKRRKLSAYLYLR